MHWADLFTSPLLGTVIGGLLSFGGSFLAWRFARHNELRDRPRQELVPLASRLLAAVELMSTSVEEMGQSLSSIEEVRNLPVFKPDAHEHYRKTYLDAHQAHRDGVAEARKVAAEMSLLYPQIATEATSLLTATKIRPARRSEAEEATYQAARKALTDRVTALANSRRLASSVVP